ncbi:Rib/alpha-like domain-containing protein [Streptococcus mitis]|uniref:YSIRK-type signal peptide-containing protein n=1 Tax=Streptococcus mitis TaxID=28037 RepID=A0A6I1TTA5_STRMT|nr:Rib/alpha-like domain-containing protein [Streptococcus mitis]MQQ28917.1 YSIRK-type signal peptide-containing protein [Streptococcus mitis]
MFKPKGRHVRQSQVEKFTRYSIRKVSFGAASVAVATGLFFLGGGSVQAAEPVTNSEPTEVQNPQNVNEKSSEPSKEVAGQGSATAKEPDGQNNTSVKESTTDKQASAVETPNGVTEKVAINTASLEDLVAKVEGRLSQLTEDKKTKSVIDDAKNLVNKAKDLLNDDTKTQAKVNALAKQLSSSLFILNSIKSEATKVNKNQNPRNGQAIPSNGESGFRTVDTTVDTTAANAASEAEKYKGIRDAAIPELQANIDKIQAQIAKEEAKPANKKDQFKIDVLKGIKQKAENVITTANAADVSSAQIMSQQAEAVKSERDLLALYLAGKADLGAPVSENHVAYGNNPTNGVFESLKEGFGDKVTFTDADKKSKTIVKQQAGPGEINARTPGIGNATYNWQERTITKAEAEAGLLNGWKIEKGEKVNAVKPLEVTDITDKDGAPSTRVVPKSKIYTNDEELIQYQREGAQLSYNAGSGIIPTITPTINAMRTNAFGEVKNRDYYLELGSKGTTISKEFDVNGNSRLNVNLIHSGAYGHASTPSTGEKVKLKIVDAFTGAEIKPVDGKSGPLSTEQGPGGGNGWTYMARLYDIPATTTKIKVLIEAGDQGTGLTTNPFNRKGAEIKDGYLVGGIGIATAPAAEIVTDVSSGRNKNEYGYTPDTIYDKNQKGSFNFTLKDTAGMNIDYYAASNVQVTIKVPKGVVLEDRVINANGGSAFLGGVYANSIRWTPNDSNDNSKGGTLTYNVPADKRMAAAEKTTRSSSIVFTTANNFIGPADFKVTATSGFGDTDAEGNKLYSYTTNGLKPAYENQFHRGGLANSDNPDFEYGKVIYINSLQATGVVTVPINTNNDQLKEVAYAKAQEEVNSANFQQLLRDMNATAAMGQITNVTLNSKDKVEITKIAADGRGVVKVPVTYTADGRTYDTTVDIEVNVVKSTTDKLVVFEGDKITNDQVKSSVTPATIDTKAGVVNNPNESDVFSTTGKAGEAGLKIPTTVTHDSNGTTINETVEVPVTVLPKPTGEVEVPKGESVDKVKEVAKAKATALVAATDFTGKLPTGATVTVGDITEAVAETLTNEKGTNKGVVNVPATYTVDGKTYDTTIPVTINVLGSEPKTVYTLEGTKPDVEKVKAAVTPGTGGTVNTPKETDLPATTVKAGTPDVTVPTTVTYSTGDETVKVPVEVLPKATPEKVTTLKDTTGENLTTAVKEKAQAALGKLTLPSGVTAELVPNQDYTVPATTSNGDKDAVPVKVQYKDSTGTVVAEDTINVPVTVVSSTPKSLVVFEGDEVTADAAKGAVTPGTDGTKGEPTTLPETAGKAGATDVKVDVPVTYDNGKLTETVSVPVTVLPKPEADEILVAKNSDKDKAKEKVLAQAKKAIEDSTFTGKLPQGATVTVDETATVTVPDLTEDTEVEVTVKYTVPGQDTPLTTTVKVPVTVVEGVPQIVPVDESNKQPDPEKSIDKTDYPDDATFEYKEEVDTSTPGDKKVTVVVKQGDKVLVEVPSTVRVVGSTPQFVVADPAKKQPEAKDSVTPGEYPDGTTFEYKTPVDTTTAGEKDVTVVAKLNGQPIAEVPAKVVVVDPKTQYVVADPSKPQPDASKSIDPEQYPDGTTFEYKTPVDTTTPGEKDVVVVAKNGEDKLVEVPTKVKVVQGNPQIVPVDEGKKQPSPEDSIDPNDYPDDATFEYKEEVDTSTPGDKKVTVVVKQGDKVLVEVPSTVRVVGSTPQFVVADPAKKQPEAKDSVTPGEYPEGTTFEYKTPVDTTTAGEKDVTVVAKLNGQPIAEVPAKVVVVDPKTQYVVADPSKPQPDASKSIDPEQYPDGTTFEYKTPVDTTTPGEKDVVVVAKNGEDKLVEVPTKVKVVQGNPQIVPVDEGKKQPSPEDSIDPNDYPDDATFEYKEEVDTSTPGDKKVTVVVKQGDKVLVEVPSTVRVVESYPKYVPVDPAKKQPDPKENINPNDFPTGTTFEYKDNTPVDTTTPGEKPVTVVAKLNGQPITEIPATIVVVEPKTQYVPVNAENDKKPKPQDSITPDDYPEGSTFEYKTPEGKTEAYDGSTPGDKDVTVVVKDSDGDTLVEVPAKIKVVQGKEQLTPVNAEDKDKPKAEDSITPSDYPEGSTFEYKVPEGQTTPYDGTTPGDKPVIVVVKDKDGKVLVEVPATIKVVETKPTPIETPVTTTPLTPEDYTKGIKIPEGGKVTNVANIPDLTTPGKKDPVKVTITLPNGKSYTVDVPVTVTPIEDIVKKEGDPITNEDVEKHIPKGAKVISIGDKPTTDIPGERPSIPVVIELPNGIRVTVNVPVIVTPKVTPVVVKVGTPVTPEDVKKHIDLPNGWKVTKVGEIPTTETPGTKPVVSVEIQLPDGRKITVDVPVIVTPTVRQIVVPQGTPVTPDDVKGHIDLPKEPGWEIVEVGEIPTTETPGTKPFVKVKVKLPDGRIITVDVPVTVTPKSQNGDGAIAQNGGSTVQIVTEYLDENGNRITSDKEGKHNPIELEGYEFSHSTTDAKGNTLHHYKKVKKLINQEQPSSNDKKELPNTGTEDKAGLASLGLLGMLGAFGLVARKKKED